MLETNPFPWSIIIPEIQPTISAFDLQEALQRVPKRLCGRYAPSPTGPLHLGNIQTALLSWLHARLSQATFILRMEDLDKPRMRPGADLQIVEDLRWLGLDWDEGPDVGGPCGPYIQSERQHIYTAALQYFFSQNRVFPCLCSRKDLAEIASAPHGSAGPVYPGTCRRLSTTELLEKQKKKGGKPFAWRFHIPQGVKLQFSDLFQGTQTQDLTLEVGDFILRRADELFSYQLAVVIDDLLMGVSHVVRAIDLLDSSARQIYLFQCLDHPPPQFCHVPLLMDPETGKRLSKRDGSDSLLEMRNAGKTAADIVGNLAFRLGFLDRQEPCSATELLSGLTLKKLVETLFGKQSFTYQR